VADKRLSEAVKSISARLRTNPIAGVLGLSLPNVQMVNWSTLQPIKDNGGQPWVRLSIIPLTSTNEGNGGGTWVRRQGLIVVDVFTAKGSGINVNQDICDAVTALFENTEFGNVKTFEATTAKIEDDPWLGYQVNINFYCEGF
jgi:hypothetical protein